MEQAAQATREDLTQRCGHECLNRPNHDGPHFYGYRMGRYSYEGLLTENARLREALSDAAEVIREHDCRLSHMVGECYLCEIVYEADLLTREE